MPGYSPRMVRIGAACFWIGALASTACGGESTRDGTGGAGSAGAPPAGSGGTSGTGGTPAKRECESAADCRLFVDCCSCEALPSSEQDPPTCQLFCTEDACSARNVVAEMIQCVGGRCILGYDCKSAVECASVPPNCSPGQVASGVEGCWGSCVEAPECSSVDSCTDCDPATTVCMQPTGEGSWPPHCVEVPAQCLNDRSCGCLASICQAPFTTCSELGNNVIGCDCPNC